MNKKSGKNSSFKMADLSTLWKASTALEASDDKSAKENKSIDVKPETSDRSLVKTLQSWKKDGRVVTVTKAIRRTGGHQHPNPSVPHAKSGRIEPSGKSKPLVPGNLPISKKILFQPPPNPPVIHKELIEVKKLKQIATTGKKPAIDRLRETSADIHAMKIIGGLSRYINHPVEEPIVEREKGKRAILGLDFGTAFTKAVINWAGNHHAVDWSNAVEGEDPYLLASVFSEHDNGTCVLGSCVRAKWKVREGIKLKILSSKGSADTTDLADAVIFLGLVFRYANQWLRESRSLENDSILWRLHVGLPTQSWDDSDTTESFKRIAQAARLLAISPGVINRQAAKQALNNTHLVDRPAVDVFPEFACQLYSYLRSSEQQDDIHALVDIGAGTVDMAFFNVFKRDDETLLPIFSANVKNLGTHYLIAALAGINGADLIWNDRDSSLTVEQIAKITNETEAVISSRRQLFLNCIANMFNDVREQAKKAYATSPAFRRSATIRLFLCGGGSRIQTINQRFKRIEQESNTIVGVRFQVSTLVRPTNIVGKFGANFDRLSVAYGLSQIGINIGNVMRSSDLKPLRAQERPQTLGRDDDR